MKIVVVVLKMIMICFLFLWQLQTFAAAARLHLSAGGMRSHDQQHQVQHAVGRRQVNYGHPFPTRSPSPSSLWLHDEDYSIARTLARRN
ncbi:hypothetical protein C1H46_014885 [Malus baccata]|uniref:Uncharacterized protein n=1 Tax=Malus baccata TaxID=106549 RepID=A0A540MMD8_MALBA|nr:hypothetical protein C1H46_014885 [Malus baccata]